MLVVWLSRALLGCSTGVALGVGARWLPLGRWESRSQAEPDRLFLPSALCGWEFV